MLERNGIKLLVRPSVRPSASISPAATGPIYVKFRIGDFFFLEICREVPNLVHIGGKNIGHFARRPEKRSIVEGDTKSP